jgi:hypothetical protein
VARGLCCAGRRSSLRPSPGNLARSPTREPSSSAACSSSSVLVLLFGVLLLVVVGIAISSARAYTVPRTIPPIKTAASMAERNASHEAGDDVVEHWSKEHRPLGHHVLAVLVEQDVSDDHRAYGGCAEP